MAGSDVGSSLTVLYEGDACLRTELSHVVTRHRAVDLVWLYWFHYLWYSFMKVCPSPRLLDLPISSHCELHLRLIPSPHPIHIEPIDLQCLPSRRV